MYKPDETDDQLPLVRPVLTARPARLGLRVSGARPGDAVRPGAAPVVVAPVLGRRLGLRANTTTLSSLATLARKPPSDEVA
ncbi:MAG: hypothetical protein H0V17_18550 [Deltaproteobacteria bacterium]|nr:hypothetical protein [Deltaproteobacteria bacterium]